MVIYSRTEEESIKPNFLCVFIHLSVVEVVDCMWGVLVGHRRFNIPMNFRR